MKISYFCIVNENDGNGAAGRKNYRPGQAENSPWAGRKNEVLSTTRDNKPMFNRKTLQIMVLKVKAVEKKIRFSKTDEKKEPDFI